LESATRSEFPPGSPRVYWLRDPTSPLAISSALWFYVTGRHPKALSSFRTHLSSSFAFLQSISWSDRASAPSGKASPATLLGFCSLQHIRDTGVYLPRVCLTRYVPPSGFGYPPGGLLPPCPRQPYFMPTALMGFHPSERSPLERRPRSFPRRRTCLPFRSLLLLRATPQAGPASPGFQATTLQESLLSRNAISAS
jgi:hypothetical protein